MVLDERVKNSIKSKLRDKIKNKEPLTSSELKSLAYLPLNENFKMLSELYGCLNCPYGAYGALKDSGRCEFGGAHANNMCMMRYKEVIGNLKIKGGTFQELYDLHMISKYFHFKETAKLKSENKLPGKSWWNNQSQVFHQAKQIHEAVEGKKLKVEREASPSDIAKLITRAKQGDTKLLYQVKKELDKEEDGSRNNNKNRRIENTEEV